MGRWGIGEMGNWGDGELVAKQPLTFNLQPATCNLQPPTVNRQPPSSNLQPPTFNRQPPTFNLQPTTNTVQPFYHTLECSHQKTRSRPGKLLKNQSTYQSLALLQKIVECLEAPSMKGQGAEP